MKFTDKMVGLRGQFRVRVENVNTGKSWIHYEDLNTIVLIAKRDVVRLIGNDNITQRYIAKMKFGDGGHISDPLDPNFGQAKPTNETMTNLVDTILTKTISSITFNDDLVSNTSSATFEAIIDTSEGNGPGGTQIYSEAGLFTFNETLVDGAIPNSGLFAIKNFPILTKTPELRFVFDWTIVI
jgi:hypothetical protein